MTDDALMAQQPAAGVLEPGMKALPVMVYTPQTLSWGDMHLNENLRASLVLQGATVPDYVSLYNAKHLNLQSGKSELVTYSEMHIPTDLFTAFHLMPPQIEPVDYDVDEPNRKMEPETVHVGHFNFYGHARMSMQTNMKNFVEVTRAEFISLYDLEIAQASKPTQQPMKVAYAQVRRLGTIFSNRA